MRASHYQKINKIDQLMDELEKQDNLSVEEKIRVRKYVSQLPDIHKIAIILRFWRCCSILEIAKFLGVSWSTADQFINEGLMFLRQSMVNEKGNLNKHWRARKRLRLLKSPTKKV